MASVSHASATDSIGSPSVGGLPPKRRRLVENAVAVEDQDLPEDDVEELRNRRIQHIVETARTLGSPVSSPSSNRQKIRGKNGMTNVQITEHYSNCLKLSAENKINSKNAFSLHLIDYMSDMLRQHDSETNFQIAGTTLDASAKIYAYRVDSVHRETFKIAGGLGRAEKDVNGHHEDDDGIVDGAQEGEEGVRPAPKIVKKRRKKITKGNTIETNEKNLNMNVADSQFAGDALFDKVRSNFDEGGSSGLFLNTLTTANDSNRLLLHCLADPFPARRASMCGTTASVNTADIVDLLANVDMTNMKSFCPGLGDFAFLGWKPNADLDQEAHNDFRNARKPLDDHQAESAAGRFAVELPPTPPLPQPDFGMEDEADDHDDFIDDGSNHAGAEKEPERPPSRRTTLDAIISAVASRPMEYSYFDPDVVCTLDNGTHWKVKAKLNSLKREHGVDNGVMAGPASKGRKVAAADKPPRPRGRPAARKRKGDTRLEFDEEIDVNAAVPLGTRGSTQLSTNQLEKWKARGYGLEEEAEEEDDNFESDNLRRLFTKPDLWLVGNKTQEGSASGDNVVVAAADPNGTGQEAPANNDKETRNDDDEGGNMDIDFGALSGGEDNDDDDEEVNALESIIKNELVIGEEAVVVDEGEGTSGAFADGLLQQPYKVDKISVPYARQAKKIDVKRLKRSMWAVLTKNDDADSPSEPRTSAGLSSPPKKIAKPKKFSDVCNEVPDIVPDSMAENLSTPVLFVCLLHMCNEKTLSLESQEDMADFTISSGAFDQEEA